MSINLRELLERLANHGEPAGAETILDRAELVLRGQEAVRAVESAEASARGRRSGWVLATGAAVLTLTVGTAALLLLPEPGSNPNAGAGETTVTTAPATTVAATPVETTQPPVTTTMPAGPRIVDVTWALVPPQESLGTDGGATVQQIDVVIAGGPGLIAAGTDGGDAALWTSTDGITWDRVPHDDEMFGRRIINGLAAGPDGYLAVGRSMRHARAWWSADGLEWTEVESPSFEAIPGRGDVGMDGVAYGPAGYVAVGMETQPNVDHMLAGSAVWLSEDGFTWERLSAGFLMDDPPIGMVNVIAAEAGYLAIGVNWRTAESAGAWTSPDGRSWTAAGPISTIEAIEVVHAAAIDGQLVATSWGNVWLSEDGLTWASAFGSSMETWGVAGNEDVIVVVGSMDRTAAALVSYDGGATWETHSDPIEVFGPGDPETGWVEMRGIVEFEGVFVVVGMNHEDGAVWIGEPVLAGD